MQHTVQLQSFHEEHGHLTEFAGFNLPLWFSGIVNESLAVRNAVGLFDVSHMGRCLVEGGDSQQFLQNLTSNDVSALNDGFGQYSLICNADGGIKDDIMVFRLSKDHYIVVYNAGNRVSDYDWLISNSRGFEVEIADVSERVALFAVQGPNAARLIANATGDAALNQLPRFGCAWSKIGSARVLFSRTGYTGEDGFEVFVWDATIANPTVAIDVWDRLFEVGKPLGLELCGLGARDLLRLEAGLCLYGADIDETTNPYEARLGFVVKLQKQFIGSGKLREVKSKGVARVRIGLVTEKRVIPRHGFTIASGGAEVGSVTSGTLSPILNTGIAMGYVERGSATEGNVLDVRIRDRYEVARVVRTPFYDTSKFGFSRRRP